MLIDMKTKLGEPGVQELLSYAVFPDPERVQRAVDSYRAAGDQCLFGFESDGQVYGLVGYRWADSRTIEVLHIAVMPEERGKGYGRGLLLELLELEKPDQLVAETDEETVGFYRNNGFAIESLGEKYPGVERFRCTFFADEGRWD